MSNYNQQQDTGGTSNNQDQRAALEAWLRAASGGGTSTSYGLSSPVVPQQQPQQQQPQQQQAAPVPGNYEDALAQARAFLASSSSQQSQQPQHQQNQPVQTQPYGGQFANTNANPQQQQQQQSNLQASQWLSQAFGSMLPQQQQQQSQPPMPTNSSDGSVNSANNSNMDPSNLLASLFFSTASAGGGLNPGAIASSILGQQQQQQPNSYFMPLPQQQQQPQQQTQSPTQTQVSSNASAPGQAQQQQNQQSQDPSSSSAYQQSSSSSNNGAFANNPQGLPLTEAAQQLAQLLAAEPNTISLLQGALQVVTNMTQKPGLNSNNNQGQGSASNSLSQRDFRVNQQQQQIFSDPLLAQLQNSLMGQVNANGQQNLQQNDMTQRQAFGVNLTPMSSQGNPNQAMPPANPSTGLINLASAAASRVNGTSSEISGSTSTSESNQPQQKQQQRDPSTEELLANVPALPAELVEMQKKKPRGRAAAFPKKLFQMLTELEEQEGGSDIASFLLPHGRSFRIHKPKEFTRDILPKYFQMSSFSSFQRQLNLYSFQRITDGPERDAYYHELFVRGQPLLCTRIKRDKAKGSLATRAAQEERLMQYEEKCKQANAQGQLN